MLKLNVEETNLPVKVNFAHRLCQAVGVAKDVCFKAYINHFEEDFTICNLEGVDAILGNTFLQYYKKRS